MIEHDFHSSFGKTLRQVSELLSTLASQIEVAFNRQADINQAALWEAQQRLQDSLDRLNEQVGNLNLMVGILAEHEAEVDTDLSKRMGALEDQTRDE